MNSKKNPIGYKSNFINPEPETVTVGQQGSIEIPTESGTAVIIGEYAFCILRRKRIPPAIGAGTTT